MNYGPGLYAVRLPVTQDGFRQSLALCRTFGDYDGTARTWYVGVALEGSAAADALAKLAGLGAVITKHDTDQEKTP